MSSSVVAELEASLQGMLTLKAPGVTGSRITSILQLCVANVQFESVLIQKIFTHFKRTPATHKLGVLYVVDSVTREWMKQAQAHGQPISSAAQDGTFAAGVNRVTELMPILMNDLVASAPEDQKEKIKKLIEIWEKAQTFPASMVNSFKEKLSARPPVVESTTPEGSPPPSSLAFSSMGSKPAATTEPSPIPNSILETLANIARQNTASSAQSNPSVPAPAPAATPVAAPTPAYTAPGPYSNGANPLVHMPVPAQPGLPYLPTTQAAAQPVNVPSALPFAFPPPAQGAPAAQIPAPGALNAVQLVAALAAQGLPLEKITAVVQLLGQNGSVPGLPPQAPQPSHNGYPGAPAVAPPAVGSAWDAPRPDNRDRNGYHDSMRSPGRPRGRSRSRSPRRGWEPRSPMSRGAEFGRNSPPGHGRYDDRDRERERDYNRGRMADYRQRSPQARRGISPPGRDSYPQEKWVEHDPNLPKDCIKVYSRTLFVGGVTCSEAELQSIFAQFGEVQSTIVHKEKRHAFVKMFYRKDAEAAKAAMEENRNNTGLQLRTRWGVGFGPRDCSDYQTGISIIPIHKLTDADRKWMLTAQYGGSGGRPIAHGLCVEEPDIEIGAGVSSKAISRRMQTDKGGNHGPKSSRDDAPHEGGGGRGGGGDRGGRRWGGRDKHRNSADGRRDDRNDRGQANNDEPIVEGLPAGFTVGRNGINVPPNFAFNPSQ